MIPHPYRSRSSRRRRTRTRTTTTRHHLPPHRHAQTPYSLPLPFFHPLSLYFPLSFSHTQPNNDRRSVERWATTTRQAATTIPLPNKKKATTSPPRAMPREGQSLPPSLPPFFPPSLPPVFSHTTHTLPPSFPSLPPSLPSS